MSQAIPRLRTFKTVTNLTKELFVKLSADNTVAVSGAGEAIIGIANESIDGSSAERYINVGTVGGTSKLKLGDTVTAGAFLKADSAGRGVTASSNTEVYGAKAIFGGVVNQVVEVEVVLGIISA